MTTLERVILDANSKAKLGDLLQVLFTREEITKIRNRWSAIQLVADGETQRAIRARLGVGIATVSRAAKVVRDKEPIVRKLVGKTREVGGPIL